VPRKKNPCGKKKNKYFVSISTKNFLGINKVKTNSFLDMKVKQEKSAIPLFFKDIPMHNQIEGEL